MLELATFLGRMKINFLLWEIINGSCDLPANGLNVAP